MYRFIYGRGPEEYGWEGEFFLMEREAAERAARAFQCRTWAEYAQIQAATWEQYRQDREFDEAEADGEDVPEPTDEFDYEELLAEGSYLALPDPREVAYDLLIPRIPWKDDPVLVATLEISHGSPAGHLECISVTKRKGIDRLAEVLRETLRNKATLEVDEALVRAALGVPRNGE
jgi:hypothetical protein